jgi:spore photoproduct lyase
VKRPRASEPELLREEGLYPSLPLDYIPRRPRDFHPERIVLSRGSLVTAERARFVEGIIRLYPEAKVTERLDTPHNRIALEERDRLASFREGKRTLVFGEHKSAVRRSEEEGNACPNYWHFSTYGYCFYGCKYCYLAGTKTVWHSPTVKIFLNLDEMMADIHRVASRLATPTAFYLGKLQDGLALDPLSGYSRVLVPFFAEHEFARQTLLTKSFDVENLLALDHRGHTILSWSVNPPEIAAAFEQDAPRIEERIEAMRHCAAAGYPVRAVMMPIIPVAGWHDLYPTFVHRLLSEVKLSRLTLGSICIYDNARTLMEMKLGRNNEISQALPNRSKGDDGRQRYPVELRVELYRTIIETARSLSPGLEIALCLEEKEVWDEVALAGSQGRCNCVL